MAFDNFISVLLLSSLATKGARTDSVPLKNDPNGHSLLAGKFSASAFPKQLSAYQYDRESANESRQALEEVLDTVALSRNIKEITVVCHSMGCQLTMEALRSRSIRGGKIGAKVRNVLLVAPDVDFNVFREQMRQVGSSRPHFALFLSRDDHALKISKSIWGGATRLGRYQSRRGAVQERLSA